jgi:hypothetical protein
MILRSFLLACVSGIYTLTYAQIPKKVLVEHFTNTLCSVCANRNPGFRANLSQHDSLIYISYHPSSPYANCVFNKHNVSQNDGRTKFYSVYGSTPRLVIQGQVVTSSSDYSKPALFSPYLNQTSPISIHIRQFKRTSKEIVSQVVIRTVSEHTYTSARLFLALAEDTIFYNAPNGEKTHLNVFRKSLTDTEGVSIIIPENIGDSLVMNFSSMVDSAWNASRMFHIAALQEEGNHKLIQAERSEASQKDAELGINNPGILNGISLYPNPAGTSVYLNLPENSQDISFDIINSYGKTVSSLQPASASVDLSHLEDGIYIIRLYAQGFIRTMTFSRISF